MDPLELLESAEDADYTVEIGQRIWKLHSLILKNGSPYFKKLLASPLKTCPGSTTFDTAKDDFADAHLFDLLVQFIYARKLKEYVKVETITDLCNLFKFADFLGLKDFEEHMREKTRRESLIECVEKQAGLVQESGQAVWLAQNLKHVTRAKFPCRPLQEASLAALRRHCQQKGCLIGSDILAGLFAPAGCEKDDFMKPEIKYLETNRKMCSTDHWLAEVELVVMIIKEALRVDDVDSPAQCWCPTDSFLALQTRCAKFNTESAELKHQIGELQTESAELKQQISRLRAKLEEASAELKQQISRLRAKLEEASAELKA